MKKYTTEPAKVYINSATETIRNRSIVKNIGQRQSFQRNSGDLKTPSTILNFKKMPTNKNNRYLLFMFERETIYIDTKTNLSLWTTKPDHCVEKICVRSFFLVRFFPAFRLSMGIYRASLRIHSEGGEMRTKSAPNPNTFHAVDARTLLRYFNTTVL